MQGPRVRSGGAPEDYPLGRLFDEAFTEDGAARPGYGPVVSALESVDLDVLMRHVDAELARRGVSFGTTAFHLDPVPRIIPGVAWEPLAAGLAQRVRALEAFVADVYGARQIVEAGRVPARVIDAADHFEPELAGGAPPSGGWIVLAGLDLVRTGDGDLVVLEDNVRTPSGFAYAAAARQTLDRFLPMTLPEREPVEHTAFALLEGALRAAAPPGAPDEPVIVVLSDGPANSAFYEHAEAARRLGIALVTLDDLEHRGDRLHTRVEDRTVPVDVVYRRTDEDRLHDEAGAPTAVAQALLEPWRSGRIGLVNGFGTGVADDKLVHAYVEEMVRFYLGEEPLVRSVRTLDLGDDGVRAEALERLDELVVKPRSGFGGEGVVVGPHARGRDLRALRDQVRDDPEAFVAQETIRFSTHPTVSDGTLRPRHVDLRPYAYRSGDDVAVLPGGLTRVALDEGALVVNSSQDGGGKDTWVLR